MRNPDKRGEWLKRKYEDVRQAYAALMKCYPFDTTDIDGEQWKPIAGYENYHVSNFGRVKSFKSGKPKILKPQLTPNGYLLITLYNADEHKQLLIHRLVAEAFVPKPEGKCEVNHRDGVKFNCHVSNLEWLTPAENVQHAYDTGLSKAGEDAYQAKFTDEQVVYVRSNPDGLTQTRLAEMFGVRQTAISAIQLGKTFKRAGGVLREAGCHPAQIPEAIREKIRAEYKPRVRGCGCRVLAKKYGVDPTTILKIVKER